MIYRGYNIVKTTGGEFILYPSSINAFFKTEDEAMNKIDSIERERVARNKANIQRVDAQIKR